MHLLTRAGVQGTLAVGTATLFAMFSPRSLPREERPVTPASGRAAYQPVARSLAVSSSSMRLSAEIATPYIERAASRDTKPVSTSRSTAADRGRADSRI